jgi:hypothetical protein
MIYGPRYQDVEMSNVEEESCVPLPSGQPASQYAARLVGFAGIGGSRYLGVRLLRSKSDLTGLRRSFGRHDFTDRVEDDLELSVVSLFQIGQLSRRSLLGEQ